MNIGIYIFENAEVLDFSGPFEVFTTAARVSGNQHLCNVFLIGETGAPVTARAGFVVVPHYGFHNHPPLDIMLIAGGVHSEEMHKPQVLAWVATQAQHAKVIASVCTGAFILAGAMGLDIHTMTTHWEDIPELKQCFPHLTVQENIRWVEDGKVISSGGITAGIDMSLHIVSKLFGETLATKTARQMEFQWLKNSIAD